MSPLILHLNSAGSPVEWLNAEQAAYYYAKGLVAWTYGEPIATLHGGHNRQGEQTIMELHPVIANKGGAWRNMPSPPLTNAVLFQRDEQMCLYCGGEFPERLLTRDHIHPQSRGGKDIWMNVVTSCKRCNEHKGARTPEEAGMPLLAVPFVPNQAEYLYLMRHRKVLGSQMDILRARFRSQRLLEQIAA